MEISAAIKKVNDGLAGTTIFDLWEIEEALVSSSDPKAKEALKSFKEKISDEDYAKFTQSATQKAKQNQDALAAIKAEYNPMADGNDEDVKKIKNFFNNVEIENIAGTDAVTQDDFKEEMIRLASVQADAAITKSWKFGDASKEEQKKAYKVALFSCLQENITILVENQIFENMSRTGGPVNKEEVKNKAVDQIKGLLNGNKKFKITNTNILGTLKAGWTSVQNFSSLLAKKTGLTKIADKVKKEDARITQKYPNSWPFLKGLGKGFAVSIVAGPVGVTAMGAYYLGETIKRQKAQAKQEELSYWKYLGKHKAQIAVLGGSIAGTIIPCYGMYTSGLNAGLITQTINGNLGNAVSGMMPTFGGETGIGQQLSNAGNAIWETMQSGTYQARAASQVTTAVAMAGEEFSQAFHASTQEERNMHMHKARRTLLGGATGIALGLAVAGAAGLDHDGAAHSGSGHDASHDTGGHDNAQDGGKAHPIIDRDGDGIPDTIDRDGGDGWANTPDAVHDFSTTDRVQSLYEHRIYDLTTGADGVDHMLDNIKADVVGIPESCTPEHAVHTAQMLKFYYGDDTALDILKGCSDLTIEQQTTYFEKLLPQFNAERGELRIGFPTDPNYGAGIDRVTRLDINVDCGDKTRFVGLQHEPAPQPVIDTNPVKVTTPVEPDPVVTPPAPDTRLPEQEQVVISQIDPSPIQNKPITAPVYVPEPQDNGYQYSGHASDIFDLDNKIGAEGRFNHNPSGTFNPDYTGHAGSTDAFDGYLRGLDTSSVASGISSADVENINTETAAFTSEFEKQLAAKGYVLGDDGNYTKAQAETRTEAAKTTEGTKVSDKVLVKKYMDDIYFK